MVPGVVLGVMPRVMRMAMIVVRYTIVVRPSGPRSQGLRGHGRKAFGGLRGFVRPNFRVAVPGVSGVSNPGLLIWLKALDIGGTCETC